MTDEPKDLVLVRLGQVMAALDFQRDYMKKMHEELHEDMKQLKFRMSSLEKQMATTSESVVAQWQTFDKHEERMRQFEITLNSQ